MNEVESKMFREVCQENEVLKKALQDAYDIYHSEDDHYMLNPEDVPHDMIRPISRVLENQNEIEN